MLEIREIFKTIQKYYGLFMNSGDLKTKSVNELINTYNNDDTNSVILSGAKDPLKTDTNNAILRGLNNCSPQNDRKNICRLMRGDVRKTIRKAAFTLAEVLITLGIIGVVAALTLPTLIQNHQKQVYVTQLKKAYSTINNAFNKMAADEGVVDWKQTYCGNSEEKNDNIVSYSNECFNRILKQFNVINSNTTGNWGNNYETSGSSNSVHGGEYMFVTTDGTTYIFPCYQVFQYNNEMVVDVNGIEKGPNQAGRDIFSFLIDFNNNKILPGGTYTYYGESSDVYKNCSASNISADCTAKVLIEGKMNY